MEARELGSCIVELPGGGILACEPSLTAWLTDHGGQADAASLLSILPGLEQILSEGISSSVRYLECRTKESGAGPRVTKVEVRELCSESRQFLLLRFLAVDVLPSQPDFTDALTGLPDRRALDVVLQRENNRRPFEPFAVLFLDLNGFKQVNDKYGHAAGDRVLVEVAQRMRSVLRDGDCVARYGGDEFVIVLSKVGGHSSVEPVVERLRGCSESPLAVEGNPLDLTISIGVCIVNEPAENVQDSVIAADEAMYSDKGVPRKRKEL